MNWISMKILRPVINESPVHNIRNAVFPMCKCPNPQYVQRPMYNVKLNLIMYFQLQIWIANKIMLWWCWCWCWGRGSCWCWFVDDMTCSMFIRKNYISFFLLHSFHSSSIHLNPFRSTARLHFEWWCRLQQQQQRYTD